MKIIEKIKILDNLIKEKEKIDIKSLGEQERYIISQQIFVLKETKVAMMHSIGLKTKEEKQRERMFYGKEL